MRLFHKIVISSLVLFLLVSVAPLPVRAQPLPIPHHKEPYFLDSGVYKGIEAETASAFRQTVQVSGVPWLRLHFSNYNLGKKSHLTITSLADGAQQVLDTNSLADWYDNSAFFNGDALEVELHVAPGDTGIFVNINEVTVGDWVGEGDIGIETICGSTDDRVASTDPRVGRIVGDHGCTGWIISNGGYLSAGHCVGGTGDTLEFNVPDSLADGTIQHPGPDDQYPIVWGSSTDGDMGDDWAVFNCNANSNTGLTPVRAQGAFYRMSRNYSTAGAYTIRITGYGVDGPAPDFGKYKNNRNSDSQTLQTHTGTYEGEVDQGASDLYHKYRVDTMDGNSGGPIILNGTWTTIGIHTHGHCTSTGGQNEGTSFENDNLENAIELFPGSNVVYADVGHPVSSANENGTVLRPYNTVAEAISAVVSNGIVSIVAGSYSKAAGNTFTIGADGKRVTIVAPVGTVYIGN